MKLSHCAIDGLTFAFYKARGDFQNKLVRWSTRSHYSHCEVIFSLAELEQTVLCHSSSSRDGGVRSKDVYLHPDHWDLVHLPLCFFDPERADRLLTESAGARYDYPGILLSHVFSLNRHSESRWFCSEFCAALIGIPNPHTYSPQALYDLLIYLRIETAALWADDCQQKPVAGEASGKGVDKVSGKKQACGCQAKGA
ncbi:hypothetical protein FDK21_09980 [Cohaesibacter sp. CAU 1516]|uniref:hypothetical protein n=1 Tax=Cohaesibacter sp. CAU 1516 TaxID=2576038 RepID=UPI0010FCF9CF|nr:hypothetical protein [Cohaesibacter sp. CAU 1516]TLP45953.1 hypothetical protein FDK21_09980 [Cohaesibacter sp. CAU 1516]